jgi:hypothetical protein
MKQIFLLSLFVLMNLSIAGQSIFLKVLTNDTSGLGLNCGHFLQSNVHGTTQNYVMGSISVFDGDVKIDSIEYILKKENSDFTPFLRIANIYELVNIQFNDKSGNFVLTNNNSEINLGLFYVSNTYQTNIQIDGKCSDNYLKSFFAKSDEILFTKINPILTSTVEPSIFDHFDTQEESFFVISQENKTIEFYSRANVVKKVVKCQNIRKDSDGKILLSCEYKNISETIGIANGILETEKGIQTEVTFLNTEKDKKELKVWERAFLEKITIDKKGPEIVIIEPKINRDLVIRSKAKSITIKGTISDSSRVKYTTVNGTPINLAGKFFSKTLTSDKQLLPVKIQSIDEYGNIGTREFVVEMPADVPVVAETPEVASNLENVGNYFALIIGINHYTDKRIPQLDNPIRDARTLKNILIQKYTFESNNIIHLENPNRKEIYKALSEIRTLIGKNDNLLLFYAGHGFYDKDMDSGYWLPSDSEKDIKSEWISFDDVIHHLRAIGSKHTLVISDACFSGGFLKERSVTLSDKAMYDLYQVPSRKVITSGNLTTVPDESVFMKYLVKTLSENQNKYLTEENLFEKIKIPVVNNSETTPLIGVLSKTGDEGGNFIFIKR